MRMLPTPERSDSGPAAQAPAGSRRPPAVGSHSKAGGRRPDAVDSKKQTLGVGALVLPPTSRGLSFPRGSKSNEACEVERLGLNRKKMARWYRRYRRSSYRRTGKHWAHDPSREHPDVERVPEVPPHRVQPHGGTSGDPYPIGPIMKVKYFRLNIVFESSVTVLWALVYVPDWPSNQA